MTYRCELLSEDLQVCGDRQKIVQCLLNLRSNAFKYTEQGEVVLSAAATRYEGVDAVRLTVRDTGIGISAEDQKKLFSRFVQLDNRISRSVEGTGLGLVLTFEFARLHHGTIEVKSVVGKGSEFSVVIPRVHQPSENADPDDADPDEAEPEAGGRPGRVSGGFVVKRSLLHCWSSAPHHEQRHLHAAEFLDSALDAGCVHSLRRKHRLRVS